MGTTCDLTEELFRAEHLGWTKLECVEFLQQLPYAKGIGFEKPVRKNRMIIYDEYGEWEPFGWKKGV